MEEDEIVLGVLVGIFSVENFLMEIIDEMEPSVEEIGVLLKEVLGGAVLEVGLFADDDVRAVVVTWAESSRRGLVCDEPLF